MILYLDMVADLFHYGHLNAIKDLYTWKKNPEDKIYIGIHNDETVESYKRKPILTMEERIDIISCCKYIDRIIPDAPLNITNEYINKYKIDLIFIPENRTLQEMYQMISEVDPNIVKTLKYTTTISTTDIIQRIKGRDDI